MASLDSLVEAANMIEKTKGDKDSDSRSTSSVKDSIEEQGECSRLSSRMNHNVLERNRRAQMRNNFNTLQEILPKLSGQKKVSNVCILKAATNEINKLLAEDTTYRKEKEKLLEHHVTLMAKWRKLQDSSMASSSDENEQDDANGHEKLTDDSENKSAKKTENDAERSSDKNKIGVNTDFKDGPHDAWPQDAEDLHIDIED